MWTRAQVSAFQRGVAVCRKYEPMLERLEQIAQHAPAFAQRISEIRILCDNLRMLSETALAIDATGQRPEGE